jgi:predicted nucleic acid-binding protein
MEAAQKQEAREESHGEMSQVLVDTGFLVAMYDRHERQHDLCARVYDSISSQLVTCEAVIGEALHLLRRFPAAIRAILISVDEEIISIPFTLMQSSRAVLEIMEKYSDIPADFADACLIHMANELDTGDILTLDSDFKHYRWRRKRRFNLLVPLD